MISCLPNFFRLSFQVLWTSPFAVETVPSLTRSLAPFAASLVSRLPPLIFSFTRFNDATQHIPTGYPHSPSFLEFFARQPYRIHTHSLHLFPPSPAMGLSPQKHEASLYLDQPHFIPRDVASYLVERRHKKTIFFLFLDIDMQRR